jgi:hypothetical protein
MSIRSSLKRLTIYVKANEDKLITNHLKFGLFGGFCSSVYMVATSDKLNHSLENAFFGFALGTGTTILSPIIVPSILLGTGIKKTGEYLRKVNWDCKSKK